MATQIADIDLLGSYGPEGIHSWIRPIQVAPPIYQYGAHPLHYSARDSIL